MKYCYFSSSDALILRLSNASEVCSSAFSLHIILVPCWHQCLLHRANGRDIIADIPTENVTVTVAAENGGYLSHISVVLSLCDRYYSVYG